MHSVKIDALLSPTAPLVLVRLFFPLRLSQFPALQSCSVRHRGLGVLLRPFDVLVIDVRRVFLLLHSEVREDLGDVVDGRRPVKG